jgi:hypothetical protein
LSISSYRRIPYLFSPCRRLPIHPIPPPLPKQHLLISTTTPGGLEDSMRTNSMDRVQSPGRSSPFSSSSLGFQLSSTPTNDHLYLHVTLMTIDAYGRLYDCPCYLSSSPLRIDDFKTSRLHSRIDAGLLIYSFSTFAPPPRSATFTFTLPPPHGCLDYVMHWIGWLDDWITAKKMNWMCMYLII